MLMDKKDQIARALEGDPHAAPRAPRLILNATDRAGLKHPSLRGEGGELLSPQGETLLAPGEAAGVFRVRLSAAELAAYRQRFPAYLDADGFSLD